jgi:hypothetical protein
VFYKKFSVVQAQNSVETHMEPIDTLWSVEVGKHKQSGLVLLAEQPLDMVSNFERTILMQRLLA